MLRRLAAGVVIGAAAWLLTTVVGRTGFLRTIELKTYDLRLRATARPENARKDIVLVEISESSIRGLADAKLAGRWPWPRAVHATVIDFIARGGARAVAVDVLFLEQDTREGFMYGKDRWSGDQSDSELVRAVRSAGNVILLADAILADERVVEVQDSWPGMLGFGPEDGPWQTEPRPSITPPLW